MILRVLTWQFFLFPFHDVSTTIDVDIEGDTAVVSHVSTATMRTTEMVDSRLRC